MHDLPPALRTICRIGPLTLDPQSDALLRDRIPLPLGRRAVALLRLLVETPGEIVGKDALYDAAWRGQFVEESNLTVQISRLRRTLRTEAAGGGRRGPWANAHSRLPSRPSAPITPKPPPSAPISPASSSPRAPPPGRPRHGAAARRARPRRAVRGACPGRPCHPARRRHHRGLPRCPRPCQRCRRNSPSPPAGGTTPLATTPSSNTQQRHRANRRPAA